MDTARYIFGVLVVVFVPPALVWWFLVHPFVRFWRRFPARASMAVLVALLVGGIVACWPYRDLLLADDLGTSWPLVALSVGLMVVTVWIAVLRRRHLTTRILVGMPELEGNADTLLQEGIYARMRHPRYVEIVLGIWAYALFTNYQGSYLVAALTVPVVHLIVLVEERELLDRFGERYAAYSARVPRYLPRLGER